MVLKRNPAKALALTGSVDLEETHQFEKRLFGVTQKQMNAPLSRIEWILNASISGLEIVVADDDLRCLVDIEPVSYTHLTLPTTPYV